MQATQYYWSWNNGPTGIKSSSKEPIRNKEDRQVIWQRTPIIIISPIQYVVTLTSLEARL
jgi:hypothetical protein